MDALSMRWHEEDTFKLVDRDLDKILNQTFERNWSKIAILSEEVTFKYSEQQLLGKLSSTIDIDMNQDLKLHIDLNQISLFDKNTKERL